MTTNHTTDYKQQALDFLEYCSATITATFIDNVPDERQPKIRHDVYRCVIRRRMAYDEKLIIPRFTQSLTHSANEKGEHQYLSSMRGKEANKPCKPSAYDILACLTKNDPGTCKDFVAEYGSCGDTLKDMKTYRAVRREWLKVRAFFTDDELDQLREIN